MVSTSYTGQTNLAAGDHLHYGVYLHGVAVLPVEWWNPKWINDNVSPKLAGRSSEAAAEAQRSARPRKAATRRTKPRNLGTSGSGSHFWRIRTPVFIDWT